MRGCFEVQKALMCTDRRRDYDIVFFFCERCHHLYCDSERPMGRKVFGVCSAWKFVENRESEWGRL